MLMKAFLSLFHLSKRQTARQERGSTFRMCRPDTCEYVNPLHWDLEYRTCLINMVMPKAGQIRNNSLEAFFKIWQMSDKLLDFEVCALISAWSRSRSASAFCSSNFVVGESRCHV